MDYSIVANEPIWITCPQCRGDRKRQSSFNAGFCDDCFNQGEVGEDISDLMTLAHNLAIGAALCRAFELGRDLQHALTVAEQLETRSEWRRERAEAMREYFHPGCGRQVR